MSNMVDELLGNTTTLSEETTQNLQEETQEQEAGVDDVEMGDLEEAALEQFSRSQDFLAEQMNIVRLNKQTRLLNLTNRSALILAKRSKDQLYDKYAKFNALRLQFRGAIVKKYGSKASAYARKIMAKTATASGPKS